MKLHITDLAALSRLRDRAIMFPLLQVELPWSNFYSDLITFGIATEIRLRKEWPVSITDCEVIDEEVIVRVRHLEVPVERILVFSPSPIHHPQKAEFLFYLFLNENSCDAIVGDLEERYGLIQKQFGKRKADFWYWTQAIRSVGPIAWAWVKKLVMKPVMAALGWMLAHGLLKDGSAMEFVKTLVEEWLKRMRG